MIRIFHTNDVHSNFDNFAKLASFIKNNNFDLLLDSGDYSDMKSIIVSGTNGKGGIDVLVRLKYDALALGNNECFQGEVNLKTMSEVGLPLLSCNLRRVDNSKLDYVKDYIVVEKKGIKFLIIGVSPYKNMADPKGYDVFLNLDGLKTINPIDNINHIIKNVEHDFCILLSHASYMMDKEFSKLNGIDLILGGHSHTLMLEGEYHNNTFIHQSGCYGDYGGIIEIDEKITSQSIRNVFEADSEISSIFKNSELLGLNNFNKVMYSLKENLKFDPLHECEAVNVVCDCLYNNYKCDFAVINNGILEKDIEKDVSKASMLKTSSSALNVSRFKVLGKDLIEAIKLSFNEDFCRQDGKGPGMRGHILGTLSFSYNVRIVKEPLSVFINGEPIDLNKEYIVMSDDYIQRGTWYKSLEVSDEETEFFKDLIRDLLEKQLCNEENLKYYKIKRII